MKTKFGDSWLFSSAQTKPVYKDGFTFLSQNEKGVVGGRTEAVDGVGRESLGRFEDIEDV